MGAVLNDITENRWLTERLGPIEEAAKGMPWAKERCWTTSTHLWRERGLLTVDLHDLSVALAVRVAEAIEEGGRHGDLVAVKLITGRGRHNPEGRSPLRAAVAEYLARSCENGLGRFRPAGPGGLIWVFDPGRAPRAATGGLGWLFWLAAGLFGAATVWACMGG